MLNLLESQIQCEPQTQIDTEPRQRDSVKKISSEIMAKIILIETLKFRRTAGQEACHDPECESCLSPHLAKVIAAIENEMPITFVLPAFPGKSPNLAKVLGVLPDMAERRALQFLQSLCDQIQVLYPPGARVVLCSDGRVFSDVVGMKDDDVTAYQREISSLIVEMNLTSISTFDLDDLYPLMTFDDMRAKLMSEFGESLEALRNSVRRGKTEDCNTEDKEANRLYCGITRFLVEDSTFPGQTLSRSAIQKECRQRAYAVIQRSQAWSNWVEAQLPDAVRLSIHPQSCGSKKLGIKLIEPDQWLTPWHGVAVEKEGQFTLLKRSEAEQLGAELVYLNGRPSHYALAADKVKK